VPLLGLAPSSKPEGVVDDAALLARMGQADRVALGLLYDRYAPLLLAAAVRMLGSPREAQDLLHDVFLEAWEHARQYDAARGTVRAWLFVRLRSRALDRLGRAERASEKSIADDAVAKELENHGVSASTVDSIAMKQAFEKLSPDVRQALELTYFEGLTAPEIAERAGVPVGTVRSRMARGIATLTELLGKEGGGRNAE
jgi:RNA polymerase sigma-70 factor (ECF subfamily)